MSHGPTNAGGTKVRILMAAQNLDSFDIGPNTLYFSSIFASSIFHCLAPRLSFGAVRLHKPSLQLVQLEPGSLLRNSVTFSSTSGLFSSFLRSKNAILLVP